MSLYTMLYTMYVPNGQELSTCLGKKHMFHIFQPFPALFPKLRAFDCQTCWDELFLCKPVECRDTQSSRVPIPDIPCSVPFGWWGKNIQSHPSVPTVVRTYSIFSGTTDQPSPPEKLTASIFTSRPCFLRSSPRFFWSFRLSPHQRPRHDSGAGGPDGQTVCRHVSTWSSFCRQDQGVF